MLSGTFPPRLHWYFQNGGANTRSEFFSWLTKRPCVLNQIISQANYPEELQGGKLGTSPSGREVVSRYQGLHLLFTFGSFKYEAI